LGDHGDLPLFVYVEDVAFLVVAPAGNGLALSARNDKTHLRQGADGSMSVLLSQIKLVAGARFERAAFRL
jgi:hypothetical protein